MLLLLRCCPPCCCAPVHATSLAASTTGQPSGCLVLTGVPALLAKQHPPAQASTHLVRVHCAVPSLPVVAQIVKAAGIEPRGVLLAGAAKKDGYGADVCSGGGWLSRPVGPWIDRWQPTAADRPVNCTASLSWVLGAAGCCALLPFGLLPCCQAVQTPDQAASARHMARRRRHTAPASAKGARSASVTHDESAAGDVGRTGFSGIAFPGCTWPHWLAN